MAPATPTPLRARKLDTIYVAWFAIHLLIMFCVDLVPLYPASLQPGPLLQLRKWYINTYQDRQFTHPTGWFTAYAWIELFYHVPLSAWAIYGLLEDHPLIPLHVLIWAVQTATSTMTCMAEYTTWPGLALAQRQALDSVYGPYLLLSLFMGADMTYRLHKKLRHDPKTKRN